MKPEKRSTGSRSLGALLVGLNNNNNNNTNRNNSSNGDSLQKGTQKLTHFCFHLVDVIYRVSSLCETILTRFEPARVARCVFELVT